VKVRNDLKNEFELRRSKRVVEFSGDDEVRREIEALQEALKKQNEDMQEMKEDMETCRFRDSGLATVQARLEITKRKALTGSLRRSNQNFITEPPVVREISLGNYGNLIPRFSTMSVIGKSYEALTPRALYNLGAPLVKIPVNGRSARRPKD
jgi:hypothetical protein